MFDFIIVGSGLAGCTIAERIANVLKQKVLIIEKRSHIGGNCYDYYDDSGILIHKYGPHVFHTNLKDVWEYLSQFTEWYPYQHKVLGFIDGKKVPIPFNLNSIYGLFPERIASLFERKLINTFGFGKKVPILKLLETKDKDLKLLADFIYEKVFLNYTIKQWGMRPEELEPEVTERVPVFISRDDRYFQDIYQGLPKNGYHEMFKRMLSSPNIKVLLNTDYKEVIDIDQEAKKIYFFGKEFQGKLIYTGKIDEFFNFELGELPYRSLRFDFETLNIEYFQEAGVVNYPNDYEFTRITEFKHLTGQRSCYTVIVREFPQEYNRFTTERGIPYYPVPKRENIELCQKYKKRAKAFKNIIFLGRLAEYKYYSMNVLVERALSAFKEEVAL